MGIIIETDLDEKYEKYLEVLKEAYRQTSEGKGKERHNPDNLSFEEQPIVTETMLLGPGASCYQVRKKARESMYLPADRAKAEVLGAINYAVAMYIYYDEWENHEIQNDMTIKSLEKAAKKGK